MEVLAGLMPASLECRPYGALPSAVLSPRAYARG